MGHFRLGNRTIIDKMSLDSTPKDSGAQKRITLFYDGWGKDQHPDVVIGSRAELSDRCAKIIDKSFHPKSRQVAITIEAVKNAKGTTYIWDKNGTNDDFLSLTIGNVVNHTGMTYDLIANLGRSEDPRNLWIYRRIFDYHNNQVNVFDDFKDTLRDWVKNLADQPLKQNTDPVDWSKWNCGGAAINFSSTKLGTKSFVWDNTFYYKPMKKNQSNGDRLFIEFRNDTIKASARRMKESLAKNAATLLFAVHDDGFNTDENGRIKQTGATHFLSVVGCNEAATEFLTIDPWPGGSAMNYRSGIFDSSENTPTLSKFMGTLKLGMRTGQWAIFGEILATPENHMGAHDYFVLNGG